MTVSETDLVRRLEAAIGPRYRIESRVASSPDRFLFLGNDQLLRRQVSLRVSLSAPGQAQSWFMLEA